MDSFKTFMSIFERAVAEKNSVNLLEILKNSRTYFQNIAKDDSELMLSILFDKNKGLLCFLNNELKRPIPQKGLDKAIKEAFELLKFIMEQFSDIFVPYIISTKNICQQALITRCSTYIQKAACNTFNKLIELFKEYEIELGETIKKFVSLFPPVDIKERSLLLSVLGTITRHCSEIPEVQEYSNQIFYQLRNDFKKQYNPQTMAHSDDTFQIYLNVFSDILYRLPNEIKEKYCEELYQWVKELSQPERYSVKKVLMRSAVNLLSKHMYQFRELIYHDYKYWYNLLINLAQEKNENCKECGQRALKNFYRMIGNTLKHKESDDDKTIFLYFKNLFEEQLNNNHQANSNMLRFIVYGFSQMAAPCKRYLTNEDVKNMFSLIASCAMPLCSRDNLEKIHLESICDYQEALSEIILHTSDLSIEQILIITKLSILLVKRFPDLHIGGQNLATSSLINTIINVGMISKNLLDEFLYNLILNGVVWTCSHTLLVDAELKRGLDNLPERPVCYKNYLPLWIQVSKSERYKEHRQIAQDVVDMFINVGITLIGKLNLNTKTKEDNVFSDVAFSQIAENEADFQMFINIVDLYVDVINELETILLVNTIHKFLLNIISMSDKHPLVSGFYKLVRATFKHISSLSTDEIEPETLELLYRCLTNVLILIPTFSNELLTTCLSLILNVPLMYVERILDSTIPIFKIAFTVGLSDFELACNTLNVLEKWTDHLDKQRTNAFLREIVPLLEPYLHSGESFVELLQDIIKTERKIIKRIILRDDENTLERFQMRVLMFIASLDTDIIMNFIYKRSMDTGATWDKKDLLKYSLMLSDMQVDIHFDKIIPRLILLSKNSGDRRTKIIACEMLHSILQFVLGRTSQHLTSNPDRFVPILVKLYPTLLNLGCDYDEAARQIFQPLMLQLTHWLSSKFMLKSPTTMHFLDSLFEGLTNDSNPSLREFSGICLAEFTKWSIKQSDNKTNVESNIDEVICKMTNFALHPSASKRIAAATAFNHLYTILREDEKIVSIYWFEILHSFVKSLNGCNDPSIIAALDHVERVLIAKKNVFNAKHHNRRKPDDFEDTTLSDAVNWLFTQCGCLDQCCREKCIKLVVKLSQHVANCNLVETMISNYINTHGIEALNVILLNNLKPKIESLSLSGLLPLLRSLDCYIWLMRDSLLDVQYLFGNSNPQKEVIFNCARNFVHLMNRIKIEDKDNDLMILSKDLEDLQTLQCKIILAVFDFIQILLNLDDNIVPDFFLNNDFFELIAKCIMYPKVIGFDVKNLETTKALLPVMRNLLKTNSPLMHLVKSELSMHVEKYMNDFIDLNKIVSSVDCCNKLKQYVQGLSFLEHQNILSQLNNGDALIQQREDKVTRVFKVLAMEYQEKVIRVTIKPSVKDYLNILMEFLLIHYEPSITRTLIGLIENDTKLELDAAKIEHGIYFLNMFKNEIFRYILKDMEKTMAIFNDVLQRNPSLFLTIAEQLFLFVQRHKMELHDDIELLVDTVIKNFTVFQSAVNNLEDRKQKLISIFGIAVHLKHKPIEISSISKDFHMWILTQLIESSDTEYKIYILNNFLVCLTDMTSEIKPELLAILRTLRNNRLDVQPNDFSQKSVKALKIIKCFQTLTALLPVTKSVTVFESVILYAAGIAEQLCNKETEEHLRSYFNSITSDYAFNSLQSAYKLFMNLNTPIAERFDVLRSFLLPSFEFCEGVEIRRFFERNIKEIHTIIRQDCNGYSLDKKQLIVSKIGCYDLVAVMFVKVDIREIDNAESTITRNAIDNVVTGKELLQSLYSSALNVRAFKLSESEYKEITRLLHCSAYNCSITIVSLKNNEDFYVSIFAENRKKGHLIWENIVDCQKQYNFQQTVKEYPKYRKRLINIRKSLKQRQTSNHYSYIHSYDLSTCTLNEDIDAFDFNKATVHNKRDSGTKEESMSLTFESDELNNHECMASICGVLNHIITEEISVLPDNDITMSQQVNDNITMPMWLKCFLGSMKSTSYDNVRLFMLKIVLNMQTVFKPYVKFFLQPIMHTTYMYLKGNQLNYIIVDVIEMLIDWQTSSSQRLIESTLNENKVAFQRLWEIIIQKTMVKRTSDISKAVYKYNMNLVKTMLELWHTYLKLPSNLEDKMRTAPAAAVYLILICFINGMEKDIVQREDILEFLEKSLENWKNDEETVLQCCECFGLILSYMDTDNALANKKCAIIDKVRRILSQMQATFQNRQVKCIRALCKNYPNAAITYFEFVTASMFRVDAQGKANCLEIFLLCIPYLNETQLLMELTYIKLEDLLRNKILPCEKVTLRVIDALISVLPSSNILSLITLVPPYAKHESSEFRESAYNIFINIYKKYATNISENTEIWELMHMSKEILLNGVLDPAEALQEKVLNFWIYDAQLKTTCKERLLETLDIYNPSASQNFLPFILLLILDLTKKSVSYTQKLFEPLYNCSYRDYKIALSWRIKNLGSKAPLFVPTLTSQVNQTFTQMSAQLSNVFSDFTHTRSNYVSNAEIELLATQEPEFEPTYIDEGSSVTFSNFQQNDTFKEPKIPQPAYTKKSKRFLSSTNAVSEAMRQKEIKKNIQRAEMIKEEGARQRSSVKLYRKYRIGDFPDIEISHAALIEPLQQLAKTDQLICKDLTVSIVCSLLQGCRHDEFIQRFANRMKYIIENEQGSNSTTTAVLEILLHTRVTNCSPEAIAKTSKSNSLTFLGSLILEEYIIYGTIDFKPPMKKIRMEDASDTSSEWLQLMNLYESMNDVDVVLSIFQNHVANEYMQVASSAQASNNWVKARAAYEKVYETESELVKEHCAQGLFECLSNLCCWDEIDSHIRSKLNKDMNNIWNDPWKDWMFPWLFEVHVHKLIDGDNSIEFHDDVKIMESWLNDDAKVEHIKRFYGEELSMFFLDSQPEVAREFLLNTSDEIREQWIKLHPLSTQLRIRKLQKLRIIDEVNRFIKILKTVESPCDLKSVLKFWRNSVPSVQDAILPWDKLMSYRMYFINSLLTDKLEEWKNNEIEYDSENINDDEENGITHELQITTFRIKLKMIEAALNQRNKYIAKKYLSQLEQDKETYSADLMHQFFLTGARVKHLAGEVETDVQKKLLNYTSSWKYCHKLLQEDNLKCTTSSDVRREISKIASRIAELSETDETFAELLSKNTLILKEINPPNNDLSTIRSTLETYSFTNLKICCDTTTTNIKECYFTLSKYCYESLSRGTNDVQLTKEFVHSILKAMSYGSLEAAHYFPCLLKPEYFNDKETKEIFTKESEAVQTWLFLSWQAQLFSNLGTSIAPLIIPILKRIVETYPNAVIYTFRLTLETNPALLNENSTYEIRRILYKRPEIDQFLLAMQYVVQPELYLRYYLVEFMKNLSLGTATAVKELCEKVYPSERENIDNPKQGSIFGKISTYKNKIKELIHVKPNELKLRVAQMIEDIKVSLFKRRDTYELRNYSPWLCSFSHKDIEIPGQYTGDRKPMPQYHARIVKFEPTVKVMHSLRKPIRITMIGNDAKEYHFLVKFGEDLRQDQRLQQLFNIMNKTLYIDTASKQRQLSIDTYQVIPLSKTVGLIQWIDNTRSLQELINFTLSLQQIKRNDLILEDYQKWIKRAASSKGEGYKEALSKYTASNVIAKMNEFISKTEWDSLRKTLTVLCPTVESFVTMRRNFITSYATMCIAHWILGIGDRHLENTLIKVDSGRCLGIDFGLAFDAGVDLAIPELMPFRLTSQILGLLKPFTEKDLLGMTMIHALRAVRNAQGPILSCMDVFVHEPLNWTEHVNRALRENEEDVTDVKWVPIRKIQAVKKKLNGIKPSLITLDQLKERHNDKYYDRYWAIVTGDDDIKRTRARMKDNFLTPEEQVECLLDQATDLNILGRTYRGWRPWL
ncbi:DNA-dependent protein kinase catalytic subunit [Anthophora quadrimaculata]